MHLLFSSIAIFLRLYSILFLSDLQRNQCLIFWQGSQIELGTGWQSDGEIYQNQTTGSKQRFLYIQKSKVRPRFPLENKQKTGIVCGNWKVIWTHSGKFKQTIGDKKTMCNWNTKKAVDSLSFMSEISSFSYKCLYKPQVLWPVMMSNVCLPNVPGKRLNGTFSSTGPTSEPGLDVRGCLATRSPQGDANCRGV